MVFRLHNFVYKVGEINGTIYDSRNNQWYALDKGANYIVDCFENNEEIENIEADKNSIKHFLDCLKEKGLGDYYDQKIHVEKILPFAPIIIDNSFLLINLFVQFTKECDLTCSFCNSSRKNFWQPCRSCVTDNDSAGTLNQEHLSSYIAAIERYNPRHVIIKGGNPFFRCKNQLFEFLDKVDKKNNFDVTIIWNGLSVTEQDIRRLKGYHTSILVNIVFMGACEEDYIALGLEKSIFEKQIDFLNLLEQLNYSYMLTVNYRKEIKSSLEQIDAYFTNQRKIKPIICEYFEDQNQLLSASDMRRKLHSTINEIDFYSRRKYNPCLFGTISVSMDGTITPCPGMRNKVGALSAKGICSTDISLKESYWKKTKNDTKCQKCGLKYLCFDCTSTDIDYAQHCISNTEVLIKNNEIIKLISLS